MKWMLFKQESTGDHYMWNGVSAVLVHSKDPIIPMLDELDKSETDLLTLTSLAQRKKSMVIRKSRYVVITRGFFSEA